MIKILTVTVLLFLVYVNHTVSVESFGTQTDHLIQFILYPLVFCGA